MDLVSYGDTVASFGLGSLGLLAVFIAAWIVLSSERMAANSAVREDAALAGTLRETQRASGTQSGEDGPRAHFSAKLRELSPEQLQELAAGLEADPGMFSGRSGEMLDMVRDAMAAHADPGRAQQLAPGELVPGAPPEWAFAWKRISDDAALVLLGAAEAARTSHEGRSLEPYSTPSVAEDLAGAIKSVRAYAKATSPETAAGPLEIDILATRSVPNEGAEARIVLCTPPTQASGRSRAVVRADQIWHLDKQPPVACEACGAPIVSDGRTCQYCGADIGEGAWRIVQVEPVLRSASPLSRGWPVLDNYTKQVGPTPSFAVSDSTGADVADAATGG